MNIRSSMVLLSVTSIVAVVFLFLLPKYVVHSSDETAGAVRDKSMNKEPEVIQSNHVALSKSDSILIDRLYSYFYSVKEKDKKRIFADSLGEVYFSLSSFDSSIVWFTKANSISKSISTDKMLVESYFKAFNVSAGEKRLTLGKECMTLVEQLIEQEGESPSLLVRKAVILVYTQSPPMPGINLLKQVIDKHPDYTEARQYLGEFMLTVGKTEKAIEQFEAIIALNKSDVKARIFLIESLRSSGQRDKALKQLNELELLDVKDSYIKQFIKEMKESLQS